MKTIIIKTVIGYIALLMVFTAGVVRAETREMGMCQDWVGSAMGNIEGMEYSPTYQERDHRGERFAEPKIHIVNRRHNLRVYFDEAGMRLIPRTEGDSWQIAWSLSPAVACSPSIRNDTVVFEGGNVRHWFTNSEEGLYHEIVIRGGPSMLDWQIDTELGVREEGGALVFYNRGEALRYQVLSVICGMGEELGYELCSDGLLFQNPTYPLHIRARITGDVQEYAKKSGLFVKTTPPAKWTAESNQADAQFGFSVSSAGDVNGDGFSDVIVGAYEWNGGQAFEGGAFVYHGSATGLSTTANWRAESNQVEAWFGRSVSSAGDVNNDGFKDVIVGAYGWDGVQLGEGRAFVYHGSPTGLSTTANWTAESDQAWAYFGESVSSAGDVNRDGFSDVIVGAWLWDGGQTNEGGAFVWYGSSGGLGASGTPANADWTAESNQAESWFGLSVSSAGDVNRDGFSDVIVGAPAWDGGQTIEGRAFVYHGISSPVGIDEEEALRYELIIYPNPFRTETVISYRLAVIGKVSLKIYDKWGRLVKTLVDGEVSAGHHRVVFDGSELPSGIYSARLQAGTYKATKKLLLIK